MPSLLNPVCVGRGTFVCREWGGKDDDGMWREEHDVLSLKALSKEVLIAWMSSGKKSNDNKCIFE